MYCFEAYCGTFGQKRRLKRKTIKKSNRTKVLLYLYIIDVHLFYDFNRIFSNKNTWLYKFIYFYFKFISSTYHQERHVYFVCVYCEILIRSSLGIL